MSDDFTHQYAIRMPNGQLYRHIVKSPSVEDFSIPSPMRDMLGAIGLICETPAVGDPSVAIFPTRAAAEQKLTELTKQAEAFGVSLYGGVIVERLCTPFTSHDPAVQFSREIAEWALKQGDNL